MAKLRAVITNERGAEAAMAVDPEAGELNELIVDEGEFSVFVVKVPLNGVPFYNEISKKMEEFLDHIVKDPRAREKIACIVMPKDQSIEHIPQAAMARFGWKRIR